MSITTVQEEFWLISEFYLNFTIFTCLEIDSKIQCACIYSREVHAWILCVSDFAYQYYLVEPLQLLSMSSLKTIFFLPYSVSWQHALNYKTISVLSSVAWVYLSLLSKLMGACFKTLMLWNYDSFSLVFSCEYPQIKQYYIEHVLILLPLKL